MFIFYRRVGKAQEVRGVLASVGLVFKSSQIRISSGFSDHYSLNEAFQKQPQAMIFRIKIATGVDIKEHYDVFSNNYFKSK